MLASRTGKLILYVLFVGAFVLTTGYCLAANQVQDGEEQPELAPIPPDENEYLEPAAEISPDVEEPCYEEDCAFCVMPLCSPPGRFWIRADWLMMWTTPADLRPLVTTSPQGTPGVLPDATILYGNSSVNREGRAGVRMTIGGWLDRCHRWGLEGDWLTLGGLTSHFFAESNGDPTLARPFYDVRNFTESAELVAFYSAEDPSQNVAGSVDVLYKDYFDSAGMTLRYNLCCDSCCDPCGEAGCGAGCNNPCGEDSCCIDPCSLYYCRTDLLVGFRRYVLADSLTINEDLFLELVEARVQVTDSFLARNEFYGSEIGLNTELRRGRWWVNLLAKIAMGNNHQTVTINGQTIISREGEEPIIVPDGVFAVESNKGVYPHDQFVVIPQFGAELGYQINCRWRAFVGWNLIYWSPVMRAGDQVDLNIDPENIPGPDGQVQIPATPFPAYLARKSDFWILGLNVGTELRF